MEPKPKYYIEYQKKVPLEYLPDCMLVNLKQYLWQKNAEIIFSSLCWCHVDYSTQDVSYIILGNGYHIDIGANIDAEAYYVTLFSSEYHEQYYNEYARYPIDVVEKVAEASRLAMTPEKLIKIPSIYDTEFIPPKWKSKHQQLSLF